MITEINNKNAADKALDAAWEKHSFREWLIENLSSKIPCEEPPEDYPYLRCYRGTGYSVRLDRAWVGPTGAVPKEYIRLSLDVDYGDDNNNVSSQNITMDVPFDVFDSKTKVKRNIWAMELRQERRERRRTELMKELKILNGS